MKNKIIFRGILAVMLLILAVGSGSTQGAQSAGYPAATGVNAASPATAPWFIKTVDSTNDVGQHVSVAIDPASGTTYVSYYDVTNKDLKMAKYVGSGGNCGSNNDWSCETVADIGDVGKYSSIAIDPTTNRPVIAYWLTSSALKLAIAWNGGWDIIAVEWGVGESIISLKIDSTGAAHIAYYSSTGSLRYARSVGGGTGNCGGNNYQCDTIDSGTGVGQYASLALDGSGQPRIAYYHGGNNALMYAYQSGGYWTIREILPTNSGQYASLYVDVNNGDLPHIAHYDATNGKLGYAVYVGSNGNCGLSSAPALEWQCDEIDSIGSTAPVGVSLAVDKAGYPIIAYQDTVGLIDSINVARPAAALGLLVGNCGPVPNLFYTWQCETLTPLGPFYDTNYSPGDYIAIDVNSAGLATIAFYGERFNGDGSLKVAYQRLQTFLPLVLKDQ